MGNHKVDTLELDTVRGRQALHETYVGKRINQAQPEPLQLAAPPDWMGRGACGGENAAVMDEVYETGRAGAIERARAVCAGCPVRERCLDFELEQETDNGRPISVQLRFGVWGGLTGRERHALAMERAS